MEKNCMKIPESIDERTKEDIFQFIKEVSCQYTPQWQFDMENPDGGTALASVYSDIFVKMLSCFNRISEKNRIEFFNRLHASVLPPMPSSGYVTFSVVDNMTGGAQIPAGMKVYGDTEKGSVAFRTTDDIYVTSVRPEVLFEVCDDKDLICCTDLLEHSQEEIHLFDMPGENLQSHELYFASDVAFDIHKEALIELSFYGPEGLTINQKMISEFLNHEKAVFEYYTANGWEPIPAALSEQKKLAFHKSEFAPPFEQLELCGCESFWIRCQVKDIKTFEKFSFESSGIRAKGVYLPPDVVYGNGIECNIDEYMPFGERFSLYNEVYFACDEALGKIGSQIDFSFTLDFMKIPLTEADYTDSISWNWVMKKSDFKVDKEYDLTIEGVIWEYYNGSGWSRLFNDNRYSDLFTTDKGVCAQYRTMRFTCPKDMTPVLLYSKEARYIRARIIKINNLYKNKGYYVAPMLSDTAFSYDYAQHDLRPQWIYTKNNLESFLYDGCKAQTVVPFYSTDTKETAVYMGFNEPLDKGPVKILFTMPENRVGSRARLLWEYYGSNGFTELNFVDETDSFLKTGLVTIIGEPDFKQKMLFGKNLYWLRLTDIDGYFSKISENRFYPCIESIHMNTVKVTNVDAEETEYFFTERYEENKRIELLHQNVIDIRLWVDEAGHLSERQRQQLSEEYDIECVYSPEGILEHVWVQWKKTEDFIDTDSNSRCFSIDKSAGVITFGNGKYGRIIPVSRMENIRVDYSCGGGEQTNLEAGTINRMEYSVGAVNGVTNPHRILGGCGKERLEDSLKRNAGLLRNHYKAVTAEDFEQLVMCSLRSVSRVRCFTGYDIYGQRNSGVMTLVVLQKEFERGRYAFNDIKSQIYRYLKRCVPGQLISENKLCIREPEFVEISVRLEITAKNFNILFGLRKAIEELLEKFLNPLTGHFDQKGWEIGKLPTIVQLQNLIRRVHGVKYIKNIYMIGHITGRNERVEIDLKKIKENPFVIPVSGKHDIIIHADSREVM